ncbi:MULTISPECIES: anthranilate synthase component II [Brevibacillus]|uniref:anthranilate synthase component II n=1 Tax=Brevibacillus TaxID=55080 RepID=UPI000BCCA691|nr:aminodeoxychorismate/anthranilate synthase component II [Brevibacillus laterosporus]MBA4531948.1 aminodeoxychorismate/anthranilate synthase component II [Brevibacillus halotolerans]PCN44128.1 aminodeoxychorismate/anthranilate synthase component II [Brevibacillus laterosporus]
MKTLLIDNYDSYTFNLYQLFASTSGVLPTVVRNDQFTWSELQNLSFDNIVISPGPGTPANVKDFGICRDALLKAEVPILGVCLGHQGIGHIFGAKIIHAPEAMHGRLSNIWHNHSALFSGIPQGFQVVRYHSLIVEDRLPECLEKTAWTSDGIIMGLRHTERPIWGVQFHPESICTEFGQQLVENFTELTRKYHSSKKAQLEDSENEILHPKCLVV